MNLESIQNAKLFQLLFLIDKDLAEMQKSRACPFCGSPIHTSNYFRKPRGGPDSLPDQLLIRHSFCCSAEGCRKRVLPVSCRFWDRKVYWGVVILVMMTLQQGRTDGYSIGRLKRLFGVSRHTLKRWIIYFKQVFPFSHTWQRIKGRIGFEIPPDVLPRALVLYFIKQAESTEKGLTQSVRFLLGGPAMF